jgi:hypothetical protein
MTEIISFVADEDDARAIHAAVARHQTRRIDGEHILPEGYSDTLGAILGEICRDWLEAHA